VRTFVLTREKFERNLEYLKKKKSTVRGVSTLHYGKRGDGQRKWLAMNGNGSMKTVIDGQIVHAINVPPQIAKTKEYDVVPIFRSVCGMRISMLAYRHGFHIPKSFRRTLAVLATA